MGAFATWNIGLRYPDRFAGLVPLCGGLSRREYLRRKPDSLLRSLLYNAANTRSLFIHGDADRVVPVIHARRTRDNLRDLGYRAEYVELKGRRHMLDFRERSPLMTGVGQWLSQQVRDAHPARIRHRAIATYMLQSFWIRMDQAELPNAQVDAWIVKGNMIRVKTKRVQKMTVFIDESLLEINKPISIEVNGILLFRGMVKPRRSTMIESWLSREDSELLYRAQVALDLRVSGKKGQKTKGIRRR